MSKVLESQQSMQSRDSLLGFLFFGVLPWSNRSALRLQRGRHPHFVWTKLQDDWSPVEARAWPLTFWFTTMASDWKTFFKDLKKKVIGDDPEVFNPCHGQVLGSVWDIAILFFLGSFTQVHLHSLLSNLHTMVSDLAVVWRVSSASLGGKLRWSLMWGIYLFYLSPPGWGGL